MAPHYFENPQALRAWLRRHSTRETELLLGLFKVGTEQPNLTWPQVVDEVLSVGWIDGVRKRIDDRRYSIRITPRKAGSIWSAVNVARMAELILEKRVTPAGLAAFESRQAARTGVYSHEQQGSVELPEQYACLLNAHPKAKADFERRPPSYRKAVCWWIVSAKQEETRQRRLAKLIELAAVGKLIPAFAPRR